MTDLNPRVSANWVSPPGETISDRLDELGWSQKELAERCDYTTKHISQLIHGRAPITEETALKLEHVLGGSARFWLAREARHREAVARREELVRLKAHEDWLRELPLNEMVKFGWLRKWSDKGQQVAECLDFFSVATVEAWRKSYYAHPGAAFRASAAFEKKAPSVGAWLRAGERHAQERSCARLDGAVLRECLRDVRALTNEPEPDQFLPKVVETFEACGVALVFVPAPRGCPVSGAARWLNSENALIILSLRHKTNDHLWFSLFHEVGHVLLHSKKMQFVDLEKGLDDEYEQEANRFARDTLIPPDAAEMLSMLPATRPAVVQFAEEVGVAPGVVVGRMQKEGLISWQSGLNHLKVRYRWGHES